MLLGVDVSNKVSSSSLLSPRESDKHGVRTSTAVLVGILQIRDPLLSSPVRGLSIPFYIDLSSDLSIYNCLAFSTSIARCIYRPIYLPYVCLSCIRIETSVSGNARFVNFGASRKPSTRTPRANSNPDKTRRRIRDLNNETRVWAVW